jgi:hypothetical protein
MKRSPQFPTQLLGKFGRVKNALSFITKMESIKMTEFILVTIMLSPCVVFMAIGYFGKN